MKLWIDSANFEAIEKINKTIKLNGITLNQRTLLKDQANSDCSIQAIIEKMLTLQKGSIAVQTTLSDHQTLIRQAEKLTNLNKERIIVKIPATEEGYKAMQVLVNKGIRVMANAVKDFHQIIHSLEIGVEYAICYIAGILGDGQGSYLQLEKIVNYKIAHNYLTKIMGGGIEHIDHAMACAYSLVDDIVMSPEIMRKFIKENLYTTAWLTKQNELWQQSRFKDDPLFC